MCWPVLPYKRLVCFGVSGDCIEVYDGFVHRATPVYTEVYDWNLCVLSLHMMLHSHSIAQLYSDY